MEDPQPREYYVPEAPVETQKAVLEELRQAEEAAPFINGVIEWFDEVITNTDSIESVRAEALRRDVSIEVAVEAYDMVREILMNKKNEFESLKKTFDR